MPSTDLPTSAKGYGISDAKKPTDFSVQEFKLKTAGPRDVDIHIKCCGVCGSDVHTITGGWGPLAAPWICPGHEIVGVVTHVGDEVTEFKVGDRAGVGAQVYSCLKCDRCLNDNENYCTQQVDTYAAKYPDGVLTNGGYSTHIRADHQFVFKIPDGLKDEDAAPMLCAGLTVYSPLIRNGTKKGAHVAIVGMGGLGHFAIQFAHALGAKVTVFSHSDNKKDDALKLGADQFITTDDESFAEKFTNVDELDFILNCADANKIPMEALLSCLKVGASMVNAGLPDDQWELPAMLFAPNAARLGGTHIGSKKECDEMLALAAEKGIAPMLDKILPMSQAATAIEGVMSNKVRYRYVLTNDLD